jgi:hypothetical protein
MADQIPRLMRRRRRPARSCDECRRRKIKCNRQMPCSHCTATRKHCVFSNTFSNASSRPTLGDTISASPGQHIGVSHVTSQQTSELVPAIPASRDQHRLDPSRTEKTVAPACHQHNTAPEVSEPPSGLPSTSLRHDDRINELESRLRTLEHILSRTILNPSVDNSGVASLAESNYASNPVLQGAKPMLNKSRLFGRTHWTNDVPEVGLMISNSSASTSTNNPLSSNG